MTPTARTARSAADDLNRIDATRDEEGDSMLVPGILTSPLSDRGRA
jgi:hypothetical protein